MPAKRGSELRARKSRSDAQRQGSGAMNQVMKAWEALRDEERLAWEVQGSLRRMKGVNYFKQVNLRRLRRGDDLVRVPPQPKPLDAKPILKKLHLSNRDGEITLELEFSRVPKARRTVWGSLPCNLGLKKPRECPRLGWLPLLQSRWNEITGLYFAKHGESIRRHGLPLEGKRIFIRVRQEVDDGVQLYEQVKAVVPKAEVQMGKKGPSSSKEVRRGFEGGSKGLRSITPTTRQQRATRTPVGGGRRRRGRRSSQPAVQRLK